MKIGVIQASSQKEKNIIIERSIKLALKDKQHEIINLGVFVNNNQSYSYVQIALCISLLLESKSIDFIVTGCSSGQGMMLACNSLPGVICGYIETISDAYLFGRINGGNAVSYPLGLNFGWAAEINLINTMKALFEEPLGIGYPKEDAKRKKYDMELIKNINRTSKKKITEVLNQLDKDFVKSTLNYSVVFDYIMKNGTNKELKELMKFLL